MIRDPRFPPRPESGEAASPRECSLRADAWPTIDDTLEADRWRLTDMIRVLGGRVRAHGLEEYAASWRTERRAPYPVIKELPLLLQPAKPAARARHTRPHRAPRVAHEPGLERAKDWGPWLYYQERTFPRRGDRFVVLMTSFEWSPVFVFDGATVIGDAIARVRFHHELTGEALTLSCERWRQCQIRFIQ